MKLKVLNFNALHGFHQSSAPFLLEEERLDAAKRIVDRENADVVVMTEACYGEDNPYGKKLSYPDLFGYPHSYYSGWGGSEWGNVVLSKYPIKGESLSLSDRTMIRSTVSLPNERQVHLDCVHFDPRLNEDEKASLIKDLIPRNPSNYLLVGDFNSLSPKDVYSREDLVNEFCSVTERRDAEYWVGELLKRKAVDEVLRLGLRDSSEVCENDSYTFPTKNFRSSKEPLIRFDYIFSSKDMDLGSSRILRDPDCDIASDHYPVCAEYEV